MAGQSRRRSGRGCGRRPVRPLDRARRPTSVPPPRRSRYCTAYLVSRRDAHERVSGWSRTVTCHRGVPRPTLTGRGFDRSFCRRVGQSGRGWVGASAAPDQRYRCESRDWRPLARRLSASRRLILFDVPGTGGSGRLRTPSRMPGIARSPWSCSINWAMNGSTCSVIHGAVLLRSSSRGTPRNECADWSWSRRRPGVAARHRCYPCWR